MLEIKQSTQSRVPVRLFLAGVPVSAVAAGFVTVQIVKSDGTTYSYTPVGIDWGIFNSGASLDTGTYQLRLTTTDTAATGSLMYIVKATTSDAFVGSIKIVANEEADTYTRVVDLHDETLGKWQIFTTGPDANRLVLYRQDGVTVLKKFDLADSGGTSTVINPFRRTPV